MAYTQGDYLNGQIVINTFLKKFVKYNGYSIPQDELLKKVTSGDKTQFLKILGHYYELTLNLDSDLLEKSMDNLAQETKDGLPNSQGFLDALKENYDQYQYVKQAFSEAGSEIAGMASDFGKGSLTILKAFTGYLPLIVFGGIAAFIYFNRETFRFSKDELLGVFKK